MIFATPTAATERDTSAGSAKQRAQTASRWRGRRRAALHGSALFVLLAVVAVVVYGDHARHGGWVGDAWVTRGWYALYPHDDFFGTVGHFLDLNSMHARPANAVYRVALNDWFGADTEAWLTWQLLSCVCMCFSIYLLMREIGFSYVDAGAVSVLLLVFPASTALWFWSAIVHASLAIALGAMGFLLALRAFRRSGTRCWVLHGASLLMFVLSVLLYEVCLPVFLASIFLYWGRAPLRAAIVRWLLDCAVLLPIALAVTGSTEARDQTVAGSISHAGDMISQLPTLLFGKLLPLGPIRPLAFVALAAIYICAGVVSRRLTVSNPVRGRLRYLLAATGAGLVIVILGYLIYVSGLDYYVPLAPGIADRVNAVAAIGWVLCLYALLALIATLCALGLRRSPAFAVIATVALAVGLGASWLAPIGESSDSYIAAKDEGDRVLDVVEKAFPRPARDSAIWTFGQPVEVVPGVPVFANYWNISAGVGLTYHDATVRGYVAFPGTTFECLADGVVPRGLEYTAPPVGELGRFGSRYGHTYFVDTVRGQLARLDSQQQCLRTQGDFVPSPQLPSGT